MAVEVRPVVLDALRALDNLEEGVLDGRPLYVHDDHRFLLPLLFEAQQQGNIDRPCTLVMLDRHHDALRPRKQEARERIEELRSSLFTGQDVFDLCKRLLSPLDDDWITSGMGLGLLDDAVIFGVQDPDSGLETFECPDRSVCQIHMLGFPGPELGYQGDLSDHARHRELDGLWQALDWRPGGFGGRHDRILLSIDLDAFVMEWEEFTFPWPDEIFHKRFLTPSRYELTFGWSGRRFFDELVQRAGIIAIAREPKHCGGTEKMLEIWNKVNYFLFDDRLTVSRRL